MPIVGVCPVPKCFPVRGDTGPARRSHRSYAASILGHSTGPSALHIRLADQLLWRKFLIHADCRRMSGTKMFPCERGYRTSKAFPSIVRREYPWPLYGAVCLAHSLGRPTFVEEIFDTCRLSAYVRYQNVSL